MERIFLLLSFKIPAPYALGLNSAVDTFSDFVGERFEVCKLIFLKSRFYRYDVA